MLVRASQLVMDAIHGKLQINPINGVAFHDTFLVPFTYTAPVLQIMTWLAQRLLVVSCHSLTFIFPSIFLKVLIDRFNCHINYTVPTPPTTCPPDRPPVNCFVDPCQFAKCPAHTNAECVSDFCGGCNARFFVDSEEVTDTCGENTLKYTDLLLAASIIYQSFILSDCPVKGQVFNQCGSACPPNCTTPNPVCTKQCVPRCQCPSGTVINELTNRCVRKNKCPLPSAGRSIRHG